MYDCLPIHSDIYLFISLTESLKKKKKKDNIYLNNKTYILLTTKPSRPARLCRCQFDYFLFDYIKSTIFLKSFHKPIISIKERIQFNVCLRPSPPCHSLVIIVFFFFFSIRVTMISYYQRQTLTIIIYTYTSSNQYN